MANASPQHGAPRIREFDALRGLAAMAVVLFHYTTRYDQLFGTREGLWGYFPLGYVGVQLFFMLSGYVIFMTVRRSANVLDFAVRRFSRLYPAYWAALALTFSVVTLAGVPELRVSLGTALVNLTMFQQVLDTPHVDGVYWSLQVELFFYLGVIALHHLGVWQRALPALFVWVTAGLVSHLAVLSAEPHGIVYSLAQKAQTVLCLRYIHLFALGMVFYESRQRGRVTPAMGLLMGCCLLVHCVAAGVASTALIASFCVVFYLIDRGWLSMLSWRPLLFLGAISYPLYLLHQNIGYVVIRAMAARGLDPNLCILIAVVLSIVLATLLTHAVERPAMRRIRTRTKMPAQEGLLSAGQSGDSPVSTP